MKEKRLPLPPQLEEETLNPDLLLEESLGAEDFEEVVIENSAASGQDVSYITGNDAEFKHCRLRGCSFQGARIKSLSCTDVVFQDCDFSNVHWEQSYFQRVAFIGCKLVGADLPGARLRNVSMRDCVMRFSNFSCAKFNTVTLTHCDLNEASLQMCEEIKDFYMDDCQLTRAEFARTRLNGIDLTTCRIDGIAVTGSYELRGALVTPQQAVILSSLLGVRIKE